MGQAKCIGRAELLLISDFPIGDEHTQLIVRLAGSAISAHEIAFAPSRRSCTWPLRVENPFGAIDSLRAHVWHCSMFLFVNREAVTALRSLGCNMELIFKSVQLDEPLSLAAGTMWQLSELEIQLTIQP